VAVIRPSTGQRFAFIDSLPHNKYVLCAIAGVSRSGYYAWRKSETHREARKQADEALVTLIETTCRKYIGTYGYRRMTMELQSKGQSMNHKRVARVTKKFGMHARIRRANPYKQIMKKTQEHTIVPNLLNRQFVQTEPERVGGTDITYIWIPSLRRFAYLSIVKDFATGEILAHYLSLSLTMPLATTTMAILKERLGTRAIGFLLHSDQGVHYTHPAYQWVLRQCGMIQSMSRKGNCIDNASTESFFGHMKDELNIAHCRTFREVRIVVSTYMSYHNLERSQWAKKKMTPIAYRDHLLELSLR
jgi:putative transposase